MDVITSVRRLLTGRVEIIFLSCDRYALDGGADRQTDDEEVRRDARTSNNGGGPLPSND